MIRVISILILFLSIHARAKDMPDDVFSLSLEELVNVNVEVITPSKKPELISHSPGIVSVFTDKEIALFGARDLGEVLSRIPGIQPFDSLNTGRSRLTIRGDQPAFNNNHVLILLNGTPFNRESYTGGIWTQASLLSVPLPMIKQIEVSRGPGSVLYGTNAFAGVVNIITKESDELEDEMTVAYGSNNTRAIDVSYAATKGDFKFASAVRYFDTDGWDFSTSSTGGTVLSDNAASETPGFIATAHYKDFYVASSFAKAEQVTIRGTPTTPVAGETDNEKFFIDLGYEHTFENNWRIKTSASYVNGRTDHQLVSAGQLQTIHYETDDSRLELTANGSLFNNFHLLVGGTVDVFTGNEPSPISIVPDWNEFLFGAYAQIEYNLPDTKLLAGAQYNKFNSIDGSIVPRFGIVHNFTEYVGFKALYGEAFRAPYITEREANLQVGTVTILGSPALTPELVTTYDLQLFYENDQLQTSITLFRNEQQDLIQRVSTSTTTIEFQNTGGLIIEGLELEAKINFFDNWYFTGSYNYQRNEDSNGIENFTLQPNSITKLGLAYTARNWSVGLFDSYVDHYHDNIINNSARVNVNPPSEAYHNLSINASMKLAELHGIKLNGYIDNLLNEDVYVPAQTGLNFNTLPTQSGRYYMLSVTVPF